MYGANHAMHSDGNSAACLCVPHADRRSIPAGDGHVRRTEEPERMNNDPSRKKPNMSYMVIIPIHLDILPFYAG